METLAKQLLISMVYLEKSHSQKTVAHLQNKCKKFVVTLISCCGRQLLTAVNCLNLSAMLQRDQYIYTL